MLFKPHFSIVLLSGDIITQHFFLYQNNAPWKFETILLNSAHNTHGTNKLMLS